MATNQVNTHSDESKAIVIPTVAIRPFCEDDVLEIYGLAKGIQAVISLLEAREDQKSLGTSYLSWALADRIADLQSIYSSQLTSKEVGLFTAAEKALREAAELLGAAIGEDLAGSYFHAVRALLCDFPRQIFEVGDRLDNESPEPLQ
jgi:hypothetical protein